MAIDVETEPDDSVQETQFTSTLPTSANTVAANSPNDEISPRYASIEANTSSPQPASTRAIAPDLLRGLLMILQSIDHSAFLMGAWRHGLAIESETDRTIVTDWNSWTGWTARMLTHLCAPGFMFLLGMGVVYFGQSRKRLGWSSRHMSLHFAIRAAVLILINEVWGLAVTQGRLLVLNIILFALAINYLLTGLLWVFMNASEHGLTIVIRKVLPEDENDPDVLRPLIHDRDQPESSKASRARTISWHLHNVFLLVVVFVTIWWNIWLSPNGGRCENVDTFDTRNPLRSFIDFLFHPIGTARVESVFPPLAWLSFAIFGLLYGRIILARPWTSRQVCLGNLTLSITLLIMFVLTRLLHVGNLSEECLRMPEQVAQPSKNQYLTSFRAFLYIVKYPPSPAFGMFTMSINVFLLALFGSLPLSVVSRIPGLLTFGTSALFFYIMHLILYFLISIPVKQWFGRDLGYPSPGGGKSLAVGNTPAYWISWLVGLIILYPMCWWYGRFKRSTEPNSIWRLF